MRGLVWLLIVSVVTAPLSGCKAFFWPSPVISNEHRAYYHRKVAEIDTEILGCALPEEIPVYSEAPTLRDRLPEDRLEDEVWPMTLFSAVRLALQHNKVIRQDAQFLSVNNPLYSTIDANTSAFDPYIQDTNITFGNRGVGAAMSDFATQLTASMQWGKDDQFNNVGAIQGFTDTTRQLGVRLEKQMAFGGAVGLNHQVNFTNTSNPNTTLPSTYSGELSADVTIPLWAAAGTEFTQIAGPAAFLVPRVTSVNQGVLISQISSEIARIDLEAGVRSLARDVVNLYWDLSLAYARVRTEQSAEEDARKVYDKAVAEFESGRSRAAEEAQSAETYYAAQARLEEALRVYDETERRFRRLLGLTVSDGRMIQPIDEPTLVDVPDNWNGMLEDALARRPQIRRAKHSLRSLQLQLKAARSLARPRLDFVGSYAINSFGDQLTDRGVAVPSFYDTLTDSTLTGWTTGVQFSMPLGFQQQRSQVNNLELRVSKSRIQMAFAEAEIAHELGVRFQNAKRWTRIVETNDKRRDAAARLVRSLEADFEYQSGDLDQLVRAQATLAQAEVEYRRALVEFRKSLAELDFVRSALLEANDIDIYFPNLPVAGDVNGLPCPKWADALPLGHHLPERLPANVPTQDHGIRPPSTGGAEGYSGAVGEVTTRPIGEPLRPGELDAPGLGNPDLDIPDQTPVPRQEERAKPDVVQNQHRENHDARRLYSPSPLPVDPSFSLDDLPDFSMKRTPGDSKPDTTAGRQNDVVPATGWQATAESGESRRAKLDRPDALSPPVWAVDEPADLAPRDQKDSGGKETTNPFAEF